MVKRLIHKLPESLEAGEVLHRSNPGLCLGEGLLKIPWVLNVAWQCRS